MHSYPTQLQSILSKTIASVLIFSFVYTPVSFVFAQGADGPNIQIPNLQVTCAPSATQVRKDTPVRWTATASGYNADAGITYRWSGVNITDQNSPTVTTSYGSTGTKTATVTVISGGATAITSCTVSVRNAATVTPPTNNNTNNDNVTAPSFTGSSVGATSEGRQSQGEGQGSEQLTQQLQQLAQSVLQCSVQNILGKGLGGIMSNIGQNIFGGLQNVAGQAIGGAANAVGGAVGNIAGQAVGQAAGNLAGGALSGIAGGLLGGIMGGGQAVPVNTVTINDYLKAHAAKTTGLPTAGGLFQSPSMDAIAYCLSNQVVEHTSEGAARWMNSGYGGNPTFIENPERFFGDIAQLETEKFIQEYSQKQQFSSADRIALNRILQDQQQKLYQRPTTLNQQSGSENVLQQLLIEGDPNNSSIARYISASADLENRQAGAVEIAKIEAEYNDGFKSKKDPATGDVIVPGIIAKEQAVKRLNLPEERLAHLDDSNKGSFAELFKKLFSSIPGMILQKLKDKKNNSDNNQNNNQNATSTRNR